MSWTVKTIDVSRFASMGAFYFICAHEGVNYKYNFKRNGREGFWYLDIYDQVGDPVKVGIKCVVNWPWLKRVVELNRPEGEISLTDTREHATEADLESLGVKQLLTYSTYEAD